MGDIVQIDISKVLREKLPNKHIPSFLVRYLQRIVHEEEMNRFLREHEGETGYIFLDHVVHDLLKCDASIIGAENIPKTDEPLIFVSNHPLGGLDGMINALLLHQYRKKPLKVVVNELLMYMTPLQELFVPVHVGKGMQSREQVRQQAEMWEQGVDVLSFPAGKCARKQHGKITEQPWHKSIIQKAIEHKRDIVPLHFIGENSHFFYNLALWRTRLGIKTNIEMLYLVDEMFGAKGKHFTVSVGKPIPWQTFDKSRTTQQWAEWARQLIVDS